MPSSDTKFWAEGPKSCSYRNASAGGTCAAPAAGASVYKYDSRGNRTSVTTAAGVNTTYGYDAASRLTSYKWSTTTSATYNYDGDGLRTKKAVGTSVYNFTYDRSNGLPLVIGNSLSWFIYGASGPIEQISAAGVVSYTHQDQQGSTRVVTDSTGAVSGTANYSAYGVRTSTTGTAASLGYQGQYLDTESGMLWLRARMYDPTTGQFIQRDPLVAATRSAYAYADNDPLNGGDPSGLWSNPLSEPWNAVKSWGDSAAGEVSDAYDAAGTAVVNTVNWAQDDAPAAAGNFVAGVASTATGGLADPLSAYLGADKCSGWYKGGTVAGYATYVIPGIGAESVAIRSAAIGSKARILWADRMAMRTEAGMVRIPGGSGGRTAFDLGAEWLGSGTRMIKNESGDTVFVSADGLRRIRFDINNPAPHSSPHAHVEELVGTRWQKSGPIYPIDVPKG